MTLQDITDLASIAQSTATALSLLVGGIWVYRRYIQRAEHRPYIVASVKVNFVGLRGDQWIVELLCTVENRSGVPFSVHNIMYVARAIRSTDTEPLTEDKSCRVEFPHTLAEGFYFSRPWTSVVDPGTSTTYHQVVGLPIDYQYIRAYVSVQSPGNDLPVINAESTVPVPVASQSASVVRSIQPAEA